MAFDKALVATGANVRLLRAEGGQLDGIHYLRALGNADAIRADAEEAEHVVLIGGSYIGTEVAASLTLLGKRCTIVMQEEVTLERGFGTQAGGFFQGVLEEHGVEVIGGDELERFEGDGERVTKVVTERGRELPADAVVIGAGAVPDTMLAKAAGLELGERRRREVLVAAGDLGARPVRGRRHLRVRLADPRPATCGSSTGTWPSTTARPRR